MKSSPRFSKFSYWSKLAQAGANKTTSPTLASEDANLTASETVPTFTKSRPSKSLAKLETLFPIISFEGLSFLTKI